MAAIVEIEVESRSERGKGHAGRLRRAGRIPAVVYGGELPPVSVTADPKEIANLLRSPSGRNTLALMKLTGTDQSRHVLVKSLQQHPLTHAITHADFVRVDMSKKVQVRVPVRVHGLADGVKNQGGLLEVIHHEVEVECLPMDIPEHVDLDVTPLAMHQSLRLSDVKLGDKVRVMGELNQMILHVVPPKAEEVVAAPVEGAAPAEPEVIKKGKKEEEPVEGETKA